MMMMMMKKIYKDEEEWRKCGNIIITLAFYVIIGRSLNKVRRHCRKKEIESQNGAQINFQQQHQPPHNIAQKSRRRRRMKKEEETCKIEGDKFKAFSSQQQQHKTFSSVS
jgi:hypothetical protein